MMEKLVLNTDLVLQWLHQIAFIPKNMFHVNSFRRQESLNFVTESKVSLCRIK